MVRLRRTPQRFPSVVHKLRSFCVPFTYGFTLGVIFSSILQMIFLESTLRKRPCNPWVDIPSVERLAGTRLNPNSSRPYNLNLTRSRQLVLVSVLTADRFLLTRAKTIHATWGQAISSGRIIFFTGSEGNTTVNFTVVRLPGVNDTYPPQRKSFFALKYVYDHFINDFHWFIRADDDVYMHNDRLANFLRKLDSSDDILVGHSGVGRSDETGNLGLGVDDNFCMGGPGVIFTQSVLRKVGPHLVFCSDNTKTYHEDSELGRCIRKHVGVMCPWAQETRDKFHQLYQSADTVLAEDLDRNPLIKSAITVHPVRNASHMFRLHAVFRMETILPLQHRIVELRTILKRIHGLTLSNDTVAFLETNRFPGKWSSAWEHFNMKGLYSAQGSTIEWVSGRTGEAIMGAIDGAMEHVNEEAVKNTAPSESFKQLNLGFMYTSPITGLIFSLEIKTLLRSMVVRSRPRYSQHFVDMRNNFAPVVSRIVKTDKTSSVIHFIVPLAGRFQTFKRFLQGFEHAFLTRKTPVALIVVYFGDVSSPEKHKRIFNALKYKYRSFLFKWLQLPGKFLRAKALELGTKCCGNDALLFFSDVDFIFKTEFHDRCRANTIQGKQTYFPKIFSRYNPRVAYRNKTKESGRVFSKQAGTWREYGFGPVCVYASDVTAVGGLNTTIRGWGFEDIDFYEKCLASKMAVFRAPDTGLTHSYHTQNKCKSLPTTNQATMCQNSRLNGVGATESLVDYMLAKGYV